MFSTEYSRFEVLFVDNGSTDGSLEAIKFRFAEDRRLRFVPLHSNLGFAQGNHHAASLANGDLYVFLNNDTFVSPDWLGELVRALMTFKGAAAAQSKLVFMADPRIIQTCGQVLTPLGLIFDLGSGEFDDGRQDQIVEILGAQGAAIAIKREAYREVGGFDPLFFSIDEDTDLCWRLWLSGHKVIFVPKSVVQHASGGVLLTNRHSPDDISSKWRHARHYYSCRNRILTLLKNLGTRKLVIVLPVHLLFQLAEGILDQGHGSRRNYLYIVAKAWVSVVKDFGSAYQRRVIVQRLRRIDDTELFRFVSRNISPIAKLQRRREALGIPALGREFWG